MTSRTWRRISRVRSTRNATRGFTLLELLLALSLTVIVLALVNMAIEMNLRSLDRRRTQVEESLLARSILRRIADDLRGVVPHYEQDTSGIESMLQQSVASAAETLGGVAGVASGGSAGGTSPSSSSSGSSPSSGSAGATSSGSSMGSASGGSGLSLGDSSGTASSETGTANTADLTAGTAIPPVPGLFGNQYQLQVDVSRLPRLEQYQQYLTAESATEVVDIPSDVKTVTYFVQSTPTDGPTGVGASSANLQSLEDPSSNTGLVRREIDRSVTMWAMENGNFAGLNNSGELLAPEVVAIEFQYFDGSQWLLYWDTEEQQMLPIAVLVTVAMATPQAGGSPSDGLAASLSATEAAESGIHLYRQIVWLPVGGQPISSGSEASGSSATGTEGSGDSSASSSGASSAASGATGGVVGGGAGGGLPGGGGPGRGGPGGGGPGGGGPGAGGGGPGGGFGGPGGGGPGGGGRPGGGFGGPGGGGPGGPGGNGPGGGR